MKKRLQSIFVFTLLIIYNNAKSQSINTAFEQGNGNKASTYEEVIKFYSKLKEQHPFIKIVKKGQSDSGEPIYYVAITKGLKDGKVNVLINNGIHPGEPEGIEASMLLVRDILAKSNKGLSQSVKHFKKTKNEAIDFADLLNSVNIYIIPVYNVDGALQRDSVSRANQNGPEQYGFRATSKNIDLNRDFIKMDSKNTRAFVEIFQEVKPHLLIDTHTSNGADYPYTITYIASQKDKMQPLLTEYQSTMFLPKLRNKLTAANFEPFVYVNAWGQIPDSGFNSFYDSPRFATGYATLFNCQGITLETHMLKPFAERVEASYVFLAACLQIAYDDQKQFILKKEVADKATLRQEIFPLNWVIDSSTYTTLNYKGYQAGYKTSAVSGDPRLYYDRSKPIQTKIKYFDNYRITDVVRTPKAYVLRAAWPEIADRLIANGVKVTRLEKDTSMVLTVYTIRDYKTSKAPYEGHYLHYNTSIDAKAQLVVVKKGDYLINMDQNSNRFIAETLEPQAVDSYFNWNFFDHILMQKEHYSSYVFEDTAAQLLEKDKNLKKIFEEKKAADEKFAQDGEAQLDFIYKNSAYMEKGFKRYPVMRLEK